jgi:transposase
VAVFLCRLKKKLQLELLKYFVLEVTARSAANLLQIQPNSAALFYKKVRMVISDHLNEESKELFKGQIEIDESYFGGTQKGKRGRGAAGKVVVFGMLKRK